MRMCRYSLSTTDMDYSMFNRIDKRCHIKLMGRKEGDKNPFALLKIYGYLLSHHFDIVHLHNPDMIKYLWLKRNYVRTVHNTNIGYQNYRWHKGIIAISEAVREDLESRGVHGSEVIDNGINFSLIKPNVRKERNGVFRMTQVNRIYFEQKGQDIYVSDISLWEDAIGFRQEVASQPRICRLCSGCWKVAN